MDLGNIKNGNFKIKKKILLKINKRILKVIHVYNEKLN
ncbi:hypothetical protein LEP1GSC109_0964 [Leptospira interrogans str. UI 13372]|uniref:Uncharacterized protein n=1 Tax=Leptospira interrogans str. UI 12621 TaxID=1049937 RepID=A0A0F6HGK5_LEPIR|nr:hypothetical protein LEP1GSC007_0006 [Leptospira interrogans serovar Bulgarica str. Mallika]EKO27515.1 hypothetical protein LEP1GSC104_3878 [Leptospira interrogans str. UI 12621]EKR18698.1 hypothetical protein LEP1GSC019_0307 [Leptospira interrogans serovar Pyrogenes str. 2006006960]EMO01804.1 hypothetical protein LEP1GSC112_0221 [Leptospira interrogans serovar Pomona str. UT364]EMO95349.1 hypothetical protein LEP1GSC109_0964 [Leptospira interrogans str. UI 13372]